MGMMSELMIEQELADQGIFHSSEVVTCPNCHKNYRQETESQVAGFREKDYDLCPYCQNENGFSMSVEYHNYKLDQ